MTRLRGRRAGSLYVTNESVAGVCKAIETVGSYGQRGGRGACLPGVPGKLMKRALRYQTILKVTRDSDNDEEKDVGWNLTCLTTVGKLAYMV